MKENTMSLLQYFGSSVIQKSPREVNDLRGSAKIVDVREVEEFTGAAGHIPGALLVPLATLEAAARAWPRNETIVTVCRSGARSESGAKLLQRLGFENVVNMSGGMMAWQRAGLAVERG
jgi:rhodanese-related sulfurtransferase